MANDELLTLLKEIKISKSFALEHLSSRLLKDAMICLIEQSYYILGHKLFLINGKRTQWRWFE